jgi:hypothetical protein
MVNNVIGVVNYVIAARPSLLNFMIADTPGRPELSKDKRALVRGRAIDHAVSAGLDSFSGTHPGTLGHCVKAPSLLSPELDEPMSLAVNTSRAPREPSELHNLVRAVEMAGAEDENEWIEWKSLYDLSDRKTHATLARHIVGMANRRVEEASRFVDGFGYILVGVEPDNRHGVEPLNLGTPE